MVGVVLLVGGCGRLGFDPSNGVGSDGDFVFDDAGGGGDGGGGGGGGDGGGMSGADAPGMTATEGLIAHFPLDSVTAQGSPSVVGSLQAECESGCPTAIAGRINGALFFDETVVLRVDETGTFQTTSGFSATMWIYPSRATSSTPVSKMFMQPGTNLNSWQVELTGSLDVGATTADAAGDKAVDTTGVEAPLDTWTHVAITWDGTTLRQYVNGTSELSVARSVAFDGGDLMIGGDENDGSPDSTYFFNGRIDDVRIYDRRLTDGEIAALAAGT